ncbi:cobalt transporter [Sporanaerobium hydrogeniformans]|uniref:Cobalt transporter n=1 Tax=Sporanaerobium hydrogeniformans TaxID=3072179 RepID=A0AC61DC98_9FIRM|nr:energy-coupling factor transporter transmembrane component T [Sporanaerobium hydrogeniformans]PHV70904.1 cobalt transporter [Sporanaerobium hydrogeniformans]
MDYLQYVDGNSLLHRLDPRTKFMFFVVMAVVTSVIKSGVALLFLFGFFMIMWHISHIQKYILVLAGKLKVLLVFIFFLWLILGLFESPIVPYGPIFYKRLLPFINGQELYICFDWYDLYKGGVYALRIFLMISSFYTVLLTTNFSEIILGLRKWHIPYTVAFAIGLIFQIIPIVISELKAIMEAQSSRGLEIEDCGWMTKIKNYVTFSLPLLFRVISKGQAISLAMHYYQLDFKVHRTTYKGIKATYYDAYFVIANSLAISITILLRIYFYIPV